MNKEKEMHWLYEEIYIYGTPYKKLIEDGFTVDEINYVRSLNNDRPIKHYEKLSKIYTTL